MQLTNNSYSGRSPHIQEAYDLQRQQLWEQYGDNPPCPLCDMAESKIVEQTNTMQVVMNDFPYCSFDQRQVERHWMILPIRHVGLLTEFSDQEMQDYQRLITDYHSQGAALYTRSATDSLRSVPAHLHTHLFFYEQASS